MPKIITYEEVKENIEKEGYKLLSTEYIKAIDKLSIKCPEGHEYKASWNKFKIGKRCPICKGINASKRITLDYDYVKEQIEKEGYELLSIEYKSAQNKLNVVCPEGHVYEVTWANFNSGYRCPICSRRIKSEKATLDYDYVKEQIEKEGYELLSIEYKSAKEKLTFKCPEGHEYISTWDSFNAGRRCTVCNPLNSKPEKEIVEYVKENYDNKVRENDRSMIRNPETNRPLELDIIIPEINKAIEFNGEYWHNKSKTKKRDIIKKRQCKKNGIELLIIWYNDWMADKEKCLERIDNFLQVI